MENHAMPNPPRFEVKTLGARIRGEGIAGIIGAIAALFLLLLFSPILVSWISLAITRLGSL
jgi:hypothetical protein